MRSTTRIIQISGAAITGLLIVCLQLSMGARSEVFGIDARGDLTADLPESQESKKQLQSKPLFLSNKQASSRELLQCPEIAFGSMDDGVQEVAKRIAQRNKKELPFIQIGVRWPVEATRRFNPYYGEVGVNPYSKLSDLFINTSNARGKEGVWSGEESVILKQVHALRDAAGQKALYARIDLSGEEGGWPVRVRTQEEIQWMTCACLGSGYDGIIWVNNTQTTYFAQKAAEKFERQLGEKLTRMSNNSIYTNNIDVNSDSECRIVAYRNEHFICLVLLKNEIEKGILQGRTILDSEYNTRRAVIKFRKDPNLKISFLESCFGTDIENTSQDTYSISMKSGGDILFFSRKEAQ